MLMPVIEAVRADAGISKDDIGFTCSGSTDYLAGQAFSFVSTLDGVGPWPPIQESHVEMDGAWALYEAWVKLQLGEVDTALVYAYGKSSPGPLHEVLSRQLDPYNVAPLWPDAISLAALQARAARIRTLRQGQRARPGRGGGPLPQGGPRQPQRPARLGSAGWRAARRRPAARSAPAARLPAHHRWCMRRWSSLPTTPPATSATDRRGSPASTTGPSRWRWGCASWRGSESARARRRARRSR